MFGLPSAERMSPVFRHPLRPSTWRQLKAAAMPRNKREIAPEQKRDEICRAAHSAFQLHGFEGASMAAIADAAGVSQNTIYWYFRSKDHLLTSTLEFCFLGVFSGYAAISDLLIDQKIEWLIDRVSERATMLGILHGRMSTSAEVSAWHQDFLVRIKQFFGDRLIARGASAAHAESVVLIGLFVIEGVALHSPGAANRADAVKMLSSAISLACGEQ